MQGHSLCMPRPAPQRAPAACLQQPPAPTLHYCRSSSSSSRAWAAMLSTPGVQADLTRSQVQTHRLILVLLHVDFVVSRPMCKNQLIKSNVVRTDHSRAELVVWRAALCIGLSG